MEKARPVFRSNILPSPGVAHPIFADVTGAAEARWGATIEALARDADAVVSADGPIPTFKPRPQLQPARPSLADPED
jgi:hypothetical protein